MAVSDATWLDQAGHIRLVGQLDGDFGGLPTGWTEDASNPANVASNDGNLDLGNGELDATTMSITTGQVETLTANNALIGTSSANLVGFYGATKIAQPAAPVTLGDVIAALQALGLVGT